LTTAGLILDQPLAKAHCSVCGLVQRIGTQFLGNTRYYEERYANYYSRTGASRYDAPRYEVMADWMRRALGDWMPRRVLDVGCGAGWSMLATRTQFPDAHFEGIEPSDDNAAIAESYGFVVHRTRLGHDSSFEGRFDLVYANNVFMHVVQPVEFLRDLRRALAPGGRIVLVCPDSTEATSELLWADHNYSFTPAHVARLADVAGLRVMRWSACPNVVSVLNKQLIVLIDAAELEGPGVEVPAPPEPAALYDERHSYLTRWNVLADRLVTDIGSARRVFNFGSSMWAWLLASYCPEYWARVGTVTIDGFDGMCQGKPVQPFEAVDFQATDALVLAINPGSQPEARRRFEGLPASVVAWNDLIRA
jgi:SAM-dependent methyltransferase